MLKPSIVLTSLTKPLHAACCLLPTNVNVWTMLTFIRVTLVELRRLQDELPSWAEQNWFVSWREGGTLCLGGFFSVYSNYGTELSQPLLLSIVLCFLLLSLEDRCRHNYFWNSHQCHQGWQLLQQHRRERSRPLLQGLKCVNIYKYMYL